MYVCMYVYVKAIGERFDGRFIRQEEKWTEKKLQTEHHSEDQKYSTLNHFVGLEFHFN
jgi:hypothetical protein